MRLRRKTSFDHLCRKIRGNLRALNIPLDTICFYLARANKWLGGGSYFGRKELCSQFEGKRRATLEEGVGNSKYGRPIGGGVPQRHRFEEDNAYKWDHYQLCGRPFGWKKTLQPSCHRRSFPGKGELRLINLFVFFTVGLFCWRDTISLCVCVTVRRFVWQSPSVCAEDRDACFELKTKGTWKLQQIRDDSVTSVRWEGIRGEKQRNRSRYETKNEASRAWGCLRWLTSYIILILVPPVITLRLGSVVVLWHFSGQTRTPPKFTP